MQINKNIQNNIQKKGRGACGPLKNNEKSLLSDCSDNKNSEKKLEEQSTPIKKTQKTPENGNVILLKRRIYTYDF